MIIIDTNVVAELMRSEPHDKVVAWSNTIGQVHTTAVTLAEIEYGIARLPNGRRKDQLTAAAARVFIDFDDVVMPFDAPAARSYAGIVIARETVGRPISVADAQIAAICASRQATLATRNTRDFDATGIRLVNPWTD